MPNRSEPGAPRSRPVRRTGLGGGERSATLFTASPVALLSDQASQGIPLLSGLLRQYPLLGASSLCRPPRPDPSLRGPGGDRLRGKDVHEDLALTEVAFKPVVSRFTNFGGPAVACPHSAARSALTRLLTARPQSAYPANALHNYLVSVGMDSARTRARFVPFYPAIPERGMPSD